MKQPEPFIHVSDHALLRYLQRAHGLDVEGLRRQLAGRLVNGARLGAVGVTIDHVKFVLKRHQDESVTAVTALSPQWPSRQIIE